RAGRAVHYAHAQRAAPAAAGWRGVLRRPVQAGTAADQGRPAAARCAGIHRPGGDAFPGAHRCAGVLRRQRHRRDAVHRSNELAVRQAARRPAAVECPAAAQLASRAGRAGLGDRALHGDPGRMDSRHPAARRDRHRPGDAGHAPVARRRRSRAQSRRLRPDEAPAGRLPAAGAHPAGRDADDVADVGARSQVHVLGGPAGTSRGQAALALLLPGRATRFDAGPAALRAGDRCLLPAGLPPVAARRGGEGGRLPGDLTRRPRFALSREDPMTTDSTAGSTMPTPTPVTASDGVTLAVHAYTEIDPQRPTVLAIHGYPDNHRLWDGVADHLAGRYNLVAYDVRGAGESERPARRSNYRFSQLISDTSAVIDSLGVGPGHLLAHDWSSIQAWAAVTDETVMTKVASLTSISGPHLNYAGKFLRSARTPRGLFQVIRQLLASGYIWLFLTPGLPELINRTGLSVKVIDAFGRIGNSSNLTRPVDTVRSTGDYLNGLNLYRANMPGPFLAPGTKLPDTTVPVQVLVPRMDMFVTPALQRFTGSIPLGSRVVSIEGGHWVVTARPDVIARLTSEWIDRVVNG